MIDIFDAPPAIGHITPPMNSIASQALSALTALLGPRLNEDL